MMSSLADGDVCIFFSFLTDGVVPFGINNCLWTVSSIADDVVCIYSFHFKRMVSSEFYSSVLYLRMVSSVLELKIVCGWCRSL